MATKQTSCDQNTQGWNLSNPRPQEKYAICETHHCDSEIIRIIQNANKDQSNRHTYQIQIYNIFKDVWDSIASPQCLQISTKLYSSKKRIIISQDGKLIYLCIDVGAMIYNKTQIFSWQMSQTNPKFNFVEIEGDFNDLLFLCGLPGQFYCFNISNGECRMWISKGNTLARFRIDLSNMYPLTDYISHRRDHCVWHYIPKCELICIFIVNNTRKCIHVKTINIKGIYAYVVCVLV